MNGITNAVHPDIHIPHAIPLTSHMHMSSVVSLRAAVAGQKPGPYSVPIQPQRANVTQHYQHASRRSARAPSQVSSTCMHMYMHTSMHMHVCMHM